MRRNYGDYMICEIASALNLSRNTVSKAINGKSGISSRTKELVLNYLKQKESTHIISHDDIDNSQRGKTIMFSYKLENIEYINGLLSGIEQSIKVNDYMLVLNIVNSASQKQYFPQSVYDKSISGIISFNIYDDDYWQEVITLGIPAVSMDTVSQRDKYIGQLDIITPENKHTFSSIIHSLYDTGRRNFAFFGYPMYCNSLYQRWCSFNSTVKSLSLEPNIKASILDNFSGMTDEECISIVRNRIIGLDKYPDAYICASDRQAILLMLVLKELGIRIPNDVAVTGFDNVPEAVRQLPPLTTVEANTRYQGILAVQKLLERIKDPNKPHEYIECESTVILRESTHNIEHKKLMD